MFITNTREQAPTPPAIVTDSLPNAGLGLAYSLTLEAEGRGPITWSIESGSLPDGLDLNPNTGLISGTPATAGTFPFVAEAQNEWGSATRALSLTVNSVPFADVPDEAWHSEPIQFVYANNIMRGTHTGQFSPDADFSRAMVVTTLFRIAHDSPYENNRPIFYDVAPGAWYAPYIAWAYGNDILVDIAGDRARPHETATRKQFARMLFHFAAYMGHDTAVQEGPDWANFIDLDEVQWWSEEALMWANYHGLITGMPGPAIAPNATLTRSQCAAILMRYVQRFA